jgi:hypothetical protein
MMRATEQLLGPRHAVWHLVCLELVPGVGQIDSDREADTATVFRQRHSLRTLLISNLMEERTLTVIARVNAKPAKPKSKTEPSSPPG